LFLVTEVSEQHIGSIFRDHLVVEDETETSETKHKSTILIIPEELRSQNETHKVTVHLKCSVLTL
jgi:UDP-N-acetylmuramyl pentapeptide synthase